MGPMAYLFVFALSFLPPQLAARVAAFAVGRPDIAPALIAVCRRESRCQAIGVHERDAHLDGWHGQVRLGHLDPECQPWSPRTWTTRGAFGLSAASHWRYLPRCYPAAALDVPIVSALVAAKKYLDRCDGARSSPWCPRKNAPPPPVNTDPGRQGCDGMEVQIADHHWSPRFYLSSTIFASRPLAVCQVVCYSAIAGGDMNTALLLTIGLGLVSTFLLAVYLLTEEEE